MFRRDDMLSPLFFTAAESKDGVEDTVDFPLPPNAESLAIFLASGEGARFRAQVLALLKEWKIWIANNEAGTTDNIDLFYRNYFLYSGGDRGQNIINLPLLQEGVPLLKKFINLLAEYPLEISRQPTLVARTMDFNKLYLYFDDSDLVYAVKKPKVGVRYFKLSPSELGPALYAEIVGIIKDTDAELEEKHIRALYKITEKNGYHRPPSEKHLQRQLTVSQTLESSLSVCAPGCHTNIYDAYLALATDLKLDLMGFRKTVLQQLILTAMASFNVREGNIIHYVNRIAKKYLTKLGIVDTVDTFEYVCDPAMLEAIEQKLLNNLVGSSLPEIKKEVGYLLNAMKILKLKNVTETDVLDLLSGKKPTNMALTAEQVGRVRVELTSLLLLSSFTLEKLMLYALTRCDISLLHKRLNSKSCVIMIADNLPDGADLKRQKGKYFLLHPRQANTALYRINYSGEVERIPITDIELFNQGVKKPLRKKPKTLRLSEDQVENLLTKNGGHVAKVSYQQANDLVEEFIDDLGHFGEDPVFGMGDLFDEDELLFENYVLRPDAWFNMRITLMQRLRQSGFLQLRAFENVTTLTTIDTLHFYPDRGVHYDYVLTRAVENPDDPRYQTRASLLTFMWENVTAGNAKVLETLSYLRVRKLLAELPGYIQKKAEAIVNNPAAIDELANAVVAFFANKKIQSLAHYDGLDGLARINLILLFPEKHFSRLTSALFIFKKVIESPMALLRAAVSCSPSAVDASTVSKVIAKLSTQSRSEVMREPVESKEAVGSTLYYLLMTSPDQYQKLIENVSPDVVNGALRVIWDDILSHREIRSPSLTRLVDISSPATINGLFTNQNSNPKLLTWMIDILDSYDPDKISVLLQKIDPAVLDASLFGDDRSIRSEVKKLLLHRDLKVRADLLLRLAVAYPLDRRLERYNYFLNQLGVTEDSIMPMSFVNMALYLQLFDPSERLKKCNSRLLREELVKKSNFDDFLSFLQQIPVENLRSFLVWRSGDIFDDPGAHGIHQIESRLLSALSDSSEKLAAILLLSHYHFQLTPLLNPALAEIDIQIADGVLSRFKQQTLSIQKLALIQSYLAKKIAAGSDKALNMWMAIIITDCDKMKLLGEDNFKQLLAKTRHNYLVLLRQRLNSISCFENLVMHLPLTYIEIIKGSVDHGDYSAMLERMFDEIYTIPDLNVPLTKLFLLASNELAQKAFKKLISNEKPVAPLLMRSTPDEFYDIIEKLTPQETDLFLGEEKSEVSGLIGNLYVTEPFYDDNVTPGHNYHANIPILLDAVSQPAIDDYAGRLLTRLPNDFLIYSKGQQILNEVLLGEVVIRASASVLDERVTGDVLIILLASLTNEQFVAVKAKLSQVKLQQFIANALMGADVEKMPVDVFEILLSAASQETLRLIFDKQEHFSDNILCVLGLLAADDFMIVRNLARAKLKMITEKMEPDILVPVMAQALERFSVDNLGYNHAEFTAMLEFANRKSIKAVSKSIQRLEGLCAKALRNMALAKNVEWVSACLEQFDSTLIDGIMHNNHLIFNNVVEMKNAPILQKLIQKASVKSLMKSMELGKPDVSGFIDTMAVFSRMDIDSFKFIVNKLLVPIQQYLLRLKRVELEFNLAKLDKDRFEIMVDRFPFIMLTPMEWGEGLMKVMKYEREGIFCYVHFLNSPSYELGLEPQRYFDFLSRAIPQDLSLIIDHPKWITFLQEKALPTCKRDSCESDQILLFLWRVHLSFSLDKNNPSPQQSIEEAFRAAWRIAEPGRLPSSDCLLLSDFLWMNKLKSDHQVKAMQFLYAAAEKGEPVAIAKLNQQVETKESGQDEVDESRYRSTLIEKQKVSAMDQGQRAIQSDLAKLQSFLSRESKTDSSDSPIHKKLKQAIEQLAEACKDSNWPKVASLVYQFMHDKEIKSVKPFTHLLADLYRSLLKFIEINKFVLITSKQTEPAVLDDTLSVHYPKAYGVILSYLASLSPRSTEFSYVMAFRLLLEAAQSNLVKKVVIYGLLTQGVTSNLRDLVWKGMDYRSDQVAINEFKRSLNEELPEQHLTMEKVSQQFFQPLFKQLKSDPGNLRFVMEIEEKLQSQIHPNTEAKAPFSSPAPLRDNLSQRKL